MCIGCVDEGFLSPRTFAAINAFLELWPEAEFGPAHIVLSDDNVEDGHILWCLGLTRGALSHNAADLRDGQRDVEMMDKLNWYEDHDRNELTATAEFLEFLMTIPESER